MEPENSFSKALRKFWLLLRDAYWQFQSNDPLRMAAATSFFASFALPPIMIILIEVFGLFADPRTIRHGLLKQLSLAIDKNIALQVRDILKNLHALSLGQGTRIAGFIFLLFVASTLFEVIRNSLDQLWRIRRKERQGFSFLLLYRAQSIGIIILSGLLFSAALLANNRIVTTLAVICWFILILRYASDGRPAWKTTLAGGIFTGLLFSLGEIILHLVLSYNNIQTIYGATTSLVLLLLFVFYCSFIFYFGACFTGALAATTKRPILPTRHAMLPASS